MQNVNTIKCSPGNKTVPNSVICDRYYLDEIISQQYVTKLVNLLNIKEVEKGSFSNKKNTLNTYTLKTNQYKIVLYEGINELLIEIFDLDYVNIATNIHAKLELL